MIECDKNSKLNEAKILFNSYHNLNEVFVLCKPSRFASSKYDVNKIYIDLYYGRAFSGDMLNLYDGLYGKTWEMPIYDHGANIKLDKIGFLRVPYRKVPIYKATNINQIEQAVEQMKKYSPDNTILLRGQNELYTLDVQRSEEDSMKLYGGKQFINEPSFLPSIERQDIGYNKLVSSWHNMATYLLEELQKTHNHIDAHMYRHKEVFHLFALGIAQHYGLPSVGLDLTDNIKVALWFALYKAKYSSVKPVEAQLIDDNWKRAYIYVFRCRPRSVFRYKDIMGDIGAHRPDAQRAYFNYCGWGLAKNSLALDLACAFQVNSTFAEYLPNDYVRTLFPAKEDDEVLKILLQLKEKFKNTELGNMLEKLYL